MAALARRLGCSNYLGVRRLGHITSCFNDWKRFCFVLGEIATGDNGRPLSGVDAQQRAQAVLTEYGYTWPGRAPVVAPAAAPESANKQAPVQSSTGTKLKSVGKEQLRSGRRRSEQRPTQHPSVQLQAAFTR